MQFSILLVAIVSAVYNVNAAAPTIKAGCDALKCVTAYAGEIGACGAAAAQGGLDPFTDVACFAAVANAEDAAPVCAACL